MTRQLPILRLMLLALLISKPMSGQHSIQGGTSGSTLTSVDTARVVVIGGRAPTAFVRRIAANALRLQLSSEFLRSHAKAVVLSRAETCAAIKADRMVCDSTMSFEEAASIATLLHASVATWVEVHPRARHHTSRTTVAPYVVLAESDWRSFGEDWSERMADASGATLSKSTRQSARQIRILLSELPVLSECRRERDVTALRSLVPRVRVLLARRPGSALARLCLATVLTRANASPDSIVAQSSAILARDSENPAAIALQAMALDRLMMIDSANVLWRRIDRPTQELVDSSAGVIHFSLAEVPGVNGGSPRMVFSYTTSREYSCFLPLTAEYRVRADTITLGPFRLPGRGVDCEQVVTVAIGMQVVALRPGRYVLRLVRAAATDMYAINITDSTIVTAALSATALSMPTDTLQWRIPRNSFALSCGAYQDAPWMCADAVRAILNSKGITPFLTPRGGKFPFSSRGNGFYHNEPPHFFRYATEGAYREAISAALSVYRKIIGRQLGYALTFNDWRGQDVSTWQRKELQPTADSAAPALAPVPRREASGVVAARSRYVAVQIGAGADVSCALTDRGDVLCWGRNDVGQLGNGVSDTLAHPVPERVPIQERVKELSVGRDHVCVLSVAGEAFCWGNNALGEVGAASSELCLGSSPLPAPCATKPVRVNSTMSFRTLSAGVQSTCGVTSAGAVVCWGYIPTIRTDSLQPRHCGDSLTLSTCAHSPQVIARTLPVQVTATQDDQRPVRTVISGAFRSCATDDQNHIYCWGFAAKWGSFIGNSPIREGDDALGLAIGYRHACALDHLGNAWCWGWRDMGALGSGDSTAASEDDRYAARYVDRRIVSGDHRFRELAAGWLHTCGITAVRDSVDRRITQADGKLYCWGDNRYGQLGVPSTLSDTTTIGIADTSDYATRSSRRGHPIPEAIDLPSAVVHVALGLEHTCATVRNGAVYCWGRNIRGALGELSTRDSEWLPQMVPQFPAVEP